MKYILLSYWTNVVVDISSTYIQRLAINIAMLPLCEFEEIDKYMNSLLYGTPGICCPLSF